MKIIQMRLDRRVDDSYNIYIGSGIWKSALYGVLSRLNPTGAVLVSEPGVFHHQGMRFLREWPGKPLERLSFDGGEASKTADTVMKLFSQAAEKKLDRKSLMVALGGGVTGDITGFLSSIYMRGVPFVQVPTSLLSMVDSSVGGKTGVDTPWGKNLMGAFHQPAAVIIDTDCLETLPGQEFSNGMAEVIKHSLIADAVYWRFLLDNRERIQKKDPAVLVPMIEKSVQIKRNVVEKDEKETSLRQILNFGHTVGHTLETVTEYKLPHGYAVAWGMLAEAYISVKKGYLDKAVPGLIKNMLEAYGLLDFRPLIAGINPEAAAEAARSDKKNRSGITRCVLLSSIGKIKKEGGNYSCGVSDADITESIRTLSGV